MAKINYVCKTCRSEDVGRDAWAQWDVESQQWQIQNVMSQGFCFKCEGEADLEEIEEKEDA